MRYWGSCKGSLIKDTKWSTSNEDFCIPMNLSMIQYLERKYDAREKSDYLFRYYSPALDHQQYSSSISGLIWSIPFSKGDHPICLISIPFITRYTIEHRSRSIDQELIYTANELSYLPKTMGKECKAIKFLQFQQSIS